MIIIKPIEKQEGKRIIHDEVFNIYRYRQNSTERTDVYNITLTIDEVRELYVKLDQIVNKRWYKMGYEIEQDEIQDEQREEEWNTIVYGVDVIY